MNLNSELYIYYSQPCRTRLNVKWSATKRSEIELFSLKNMITTSYRIYTISEYFTQFTQCLQIHKARLYRNQMCHSEHNSYNYKQLTS